MVTIKNRSWRKTTISENIEHVESKGKIKLGQSSNGTKQIMTNPTGSTTSTSTVISHKKNISLKTNNNIVHNPTVAKNNNTTKYDFDGTSMKTQIDNKLQIEDKPVSHSTTLNPLNSSTILILIPLTLRTMKLII